MKLLGIDTGGTFTDFVYFDGCHLLAHKVLSVPATPERAIMQGIREMGISLSSDLRIIHGSTVATNAVLEGQGAKVVYITNRGFADVLTIGRQARKQLYQLQPIKTPPPVASELCLETGGRLDAEARVLEPLTQADIETLKQQIALRKPESIAINLLFSFLDNTFEQQIAAALEDHYFVSCSSTVLPEIREYERGICVWLNAYVGPIMQDYLQRLEKQLGQTRLSVMRSTGHTCSPQQAGEEAVHLLLSGPAGGLIGAQYIASRQNKDVKILSFDMGGTSTDVALIDGEIILTGEGHIAGYPVSVPMVDMHTIGAGGGSIAYCDAGGLLQVGPESAGAQPGPACYGQGGVRATVTDANVLLGRLPAVTRLAGRLPLDIEAADSALSSLARELSLPGAREAALGVINIVNEHMAEALRVISIQRGYDPKDFSLLAFGGAGGLHMCALAEALEIRQVIAPAHAGVLSALGMLVAPAGRQLSKTLACLLADISEAEINRGFDELCQMGNAALLDEGYQLEDLEYQHSLELCYRGQAHTLNIAWNNIPACEQTFHQLHEQRFGHRLQSPVELINLRLTLGAKPETIPIQAMVTDDHLEDLSISDTKIFPRNRLKPGYRVDGPLSIIDRAATLWIPPGWTVSVDECTNVIAVKDS